MKERQERQQKQEQAKNDRVLNYVRSWRGEVAPEVWRALDLCAEILEGEPLTLDERRIWVDALKGEQVNDIPMETIERGGQQVFLEGFYRDFLARRQAEVEKALIAKALACSTQKPKKKKKTTGRKM